MSFLSKVEKKALLALAKKAKGFNLNVAQYLNASSYGEALDLFFNNLLRDIRELNSIYATESVAALKPKKEQLREKIQNFCRNTSTLLAGHIEEFIQLSKAFKKPKIKVINAEKDEELDARVKKFKLQLTKEFKKLRSDAQTYFNYDTMFDLDLSEEYIIALKCWKKITYNSFVTMLKEGKIGWLKLPESDDE